MKIIISKEGRPLRLSGVFQENGIYYIRFKYLDNDEYQVVKYSEETILKLI